MLRFSRLALFLAVITVVAAAPALHAQYIVPRGNAFIGYSYTHLDFGQGVTRNVNGYEMSVEGQVLPFLGLEGDYSGHYGQSNLHEQNFLFGPHVSARLGRVTPFGHLLFGGAHLSGINTSETSFAQAIGGGVDLQLAEPIAWRTQLDYLRTNFFSTGQGNVRFSTGIVFSF